MSPTHEPWLVALSLVVAFQGSYVGLHIARGIGAACGLARRRRIASAALSLALAIWTMHFVGMLAVRLPVPVDFLVLPTLISFLVCVLVVGAAVIVVGARAPSATTIALSAIFMGAGIVTMHYLGMAALHDGLHMTHDPLSVALAAAVGVAASGAALWFGFAGGVGRSILPSAGAMALAIAAMHYTAMAGVGFHVLEPPASGQPALSPGTLAVVVSVVAFVVSGLFLLTLVPVEAEATVRSAAPSPAPAAGSREDAPPAAGPQPATHVPVEKDGRRLALDAGRLMAVQAQGHYCQLFDGEQTWFCPLSISELEAQLDPTVFARVHRSHIVNLDCVRAVRRYGDAGLLSLGTRVPWQVPVARSRRGWLREVLQTRVRAAE